jgi:hypothetical protein
MREDKGDGEKRESVKKNLGVYIKQYPLLRKQIWLIRHDFRLTQSEIREVRDGI